jgi:hypothetical protein
MGEPYHVVGWKPVPRACCYEISTDGAIRRAQPGNGRAGGKRRGLVGQIINPCVANTGYLCVNLIHDDGKWRVRNVHAILGEAYLKQGEGQTHVAHHNGVKLDIRLSNLAWKTPAQNAGDSELHRTRVRGNRHPNTKIPDEMLQTIREWAGSTRQLADSFSVSRSTIDRIRRAAERAYSVSEKLKDIGGDLAG